MIWKAMDEEITKWMPTELKQHVQAMRQIDAFKKRSTQNQKNKTTGPKRGTLHSLGSISASQWASLEIELKLSTLGIGLLLFLSPNIVESVMLQLSDVGYFVAIHNGTQVDDDEIFLQAVGGKNKKGTVYGLGTESEAYYPRSAHRSALVATTYTLSIVSQMEARLKNQKMIFKLRGRSLGPLGRSKNNKER
ncbi:hypothetical protein Cgig2_021295 [Carnegiea gigantea]|uniref:Uncharacterized protein n=1 Tax=Carnegiea gigantea TaxID=171969 RepID=A0A9Q1K5G4_9CARY|nr:hypothetical protein Cgig2_021295 [Carnegiea gigantea]